MALTNVLQFVATLVCVAALSRAQDTDYKSRARDVQTAMYMVLRQLALPGTENGNATSRFVLQLPGKVLSYQDYYPGDAYVESLSKVGDNEKSFLEVPPKIMENMFRLTDAVPGVDPLRGGDTGESFVEHYEAALGNLDVRGFNQKTRDALTKYKQAVKFLSEGIQDPENLDEQVSRLDLYRRLQSRYNQKRLDMEDMIAGNRSQLGSLDYQYWFQRNFPPLYSEVEGAYTEWLVFGQKDLVELYKAHIDTESQGVDLEEARMALRASGTTSLDRTQTVYPVAFEPSTWYEALVPKSKGMTRDEIQIQLGDLRAKKVMLEMIAEGGTPPGGEELLESLKARVDAGSSDVEEKTTELQRLRVACLKRNRSPVSAVETIDDGVDPCADFGLAQDQAVQSTTAQGQLEAEYDNAKFLMASGDKAKQAIRRTIAQLQVRIEELEQRLENAPGAQPEVAEEAVPKDTDFDASWMDFEFDSSQSKEITDSKSTSLSVAAEFSANAGLWRVSGGASYSRAEQDFAQDMSSSDLKVKAKLLKVTIKRPWFRTTLFKNKHLVTRDATMLSPGPMPEDTFVHELQRRDRTYLLPQFSNAFLLAKDVELEFRGVSSKTVSHALSQSASSHLEGGFGPFSASSSMNYGSDENHLSTEATADGLKIRIPGAQVVGYYVTVLPKFPQNQP